jgi:TonB-dependent receptor
MLNKFTIINSLIIFLLLYSPFSYTQSGSLKGTIRNVQTNDPLPYSNIILLKTSLGSSANQDGEYIVRNIPVGTYTVRVTYLGYKQTETIVNILAGKTTEYNAELEPEVLEGETVEVTAQAEAQRQAINEQLSSIPIKNVVSAARIQELPDVNAAESVSRLPGVSLIRTGGEGSKVVIRGLSPQYNQITVDGVELPSNVSSDNTVISTDKTAQASASILGDRAADLSMISSSMLGGIEVIKAITPDMDATLIGGVVNFGLRKASKSVLTRNINAPWLPRISLTTQGSYNDLKSEYKDYKFIGSVERRFFNESFGMYLMGSVEKRNLSANELGAYYDLKDKDHGDAGIPDLSNLSLNDVYRERERDGLTAVLDYSHSSGEIGLMNVFSSSDTREVHRNEKIVLTSDDLWYGIGDYYEKMNVISNLLSIKQDIPLFHVELKFSHSYTEKRNPEDLFFNFWQETAGLANKGDLTKVHPKHLASLVEHDFSRAGQIELTTSKKFSKDRVIGAALNFETTPFTFSDLFSAKIKLGGAYNLRDRSYDFDYSSGSQGYSGGGNVVSAWQQAYPELQFAGGRVGLINFIDSSYDFGEFLNGEYRLAYPASPDLMWELLPIAKRTSSLEGYRVNKLGTKYNDYKGNEEKSAAYIMSTFNIGDFITILPGVRYQNLTTDFTALRAETTAGGEFQGGDTSVIKSHGFFLPMVHLRYKPLDWFQLHFAYTNTLNYPDFSTIIPRFLVTQGFVNYNNVNLKPATSENFDLVATVFMNEIGLFSVNGFKKKIEDLIFYSKTYVTDFEKYPDLPQGKKQLYEFHTYINNPHPIDVWGIETEWQTHFWYLPYPLNGIILNINYTHIFSEASYPRSIYNAEYDQYGNLVTTIVDTFYTTRLLNQPNDILNLAFGYDLGGFSARLSLLYQDNIFKQPDFWMQNRINSDKFVRWDLSVKQELPWYSIQVYFNLNNITGENDVDINQKNNFPAREQRYGMTADLGIRLVL